MKPFIATETGYHNCTASDQVIGSQQRGISEQAGGKYFPRLFAEYWNSGFAKTFTYEFLDEFVKPDDPEANFGMIHHDLTPKPAFTAVSNMIAILTESHWDTLKHLWVGPVETPRALELAITGPATVHHTLLTRADGSFDLLLWNEIPSYDIGKRQDIANPDVPVTLQLASSAKVELYRPLAGITPQQHLEASNTFNISVPDEVIILHLTPKAVGSTKAPTAPTALAVTTTGNSATLTWKNVGAGPVAYVVRRLNKYTATVVPGADGAGAYSDSSLSPGLGYAYTVQAVTLTGVLSAPAAITANTLNLRPDLTINSISWTPTDPKAGDEVQFTAVIANIGLAATPAVTHGVSFSVDGHVVSWSDTSSDPLESGRSRTLTTDNGPAAKATWTAVSGPHQVTATVDDVNRIDESNKLNNTIGPISLMVK
jgi:hypothetical protein